MNYFQVKLLYQQFYNLIRPNMNEKLEKTKRAFSVKNIIKRQKITFQKQVQILRRDYSNKNRYKQMKHSQQSKSKIFDKNKLQKLQAEQISKDKIGNFLQPTKIISVTAPKWALFDFYSSMYIRGYRSHDAHDLSTFSKLLVFCAINALIVKHKIDLQRFQCIVTKSALKWVEQHDYETLVKEEDILSMKDALHLMLMTQGFQYQLIIGLNVGAYIQKKQRKEYYSVYDANDKKFKQQLSLFYELVNSYCNFLKLQSVKYVQHDPTSRKEKNVCSAYDVALISIECLKIPLFMQILRKKEYECSIRYIDDQGHMENRKVPLVNKSVSNPFISYFNVNRNWGEKQFMCSNCSVYYENNEEIQPIRPIVIVLLGAYSPIDREKDIQQVAEWYLKNKDSNPAIRKGFLQEKSKPKLEKVEQRRLKTEAGNTNTKKQQVNQKVLQNMLSQKLSVESNSKYDLFLRTIKLKDPKQKLKTVQ